MRFGIHSADVCAVHLATKLKLAAVADESGVVSVLDLMQVGQREGGLLVRFMLRFLQCAPQEPPPHLTPPTQPTTHNTHHAPHSRPQPALLWTTRALPRPVRHLVLGCHIVPAARDKGAAASSSSDQPVAGTERWAGQFSFPGGDGHGDILAVRGILFQTHRGAEPR